MTGLLSLISKLEQSAGQSRELDIQIALVVGFYSEGRSDGNWTVNFVQKHLAHPDTCHATMANNFGTPRYTGSLDAALSGVDPDDWIDISHRIDAQTGQRFCGADIGQDRQGNPFHGRGATFPLAICIARLRALQSIGHHSKTTEEAA